MNNYWNKIGNFVKLIWKVSAISRVYIRWIYEKKIDRISRPLSLNSQPRFRNYRMKLIVWMIREISKMLNQCAVDNPTLPVNQLFFPPHPILEGMLSRSLGMSSRNDGPPDIWDTHGVSGNVFANPAASSSAPYSQALNPWSSNVSEHTSPHVSESQTPVQDPRCQSGPSARNSVIPSEGEFSKNYGADQQRLQISDPHLDKFTTPATFASIRLLEDKIQDWGMYLITIPYVSYVAFQVGQSCRIPSSLQLWDVSMRETLREWFRWLRRSPLRSPVCLGYEPRGSATRLLCPSYRKGVTNVTFSTISWVLCCCYWLLSRELLPQTAPSRVCCSRHHPMTFFRVVTCSTAVRLTVSASGSLAGWFRGRGPELLLHYHVRVAHVPVVYWAREVT